MCCFSQLSLLTEQLAHLIRIDPFTILPREVCLKVLENLDATSLCRAAQVSRHWRVLADDNILWLGICEQHIGQKCLKCGWGLPILDKKLASRMQSSSPPPRLGLTSSSSKRRVLEAGSYLPDRPMKRQRSEPANLPSITGAIYSSNNHIPSTSPSCFSNSIYSSLTLPTTVTRHWKDVYSERLTIERNWRRGQCTIRTLTGHADGVMCLQFSEWLSHPSYPILITGSYDRTARVWNLETGAELRCLKGHTRAVRALQFDEVKLITGSMDNTIRVWDWRKGKCIRILEGHTGGVVCLKFDSNVLASGSVDNTVKVWNLRTQEAFTLRGHTDWVNAVQLWDSNASSDVSASPSEIPAMDPLSTIPPSSVCAAPHIDPGKMLFSASDDGTIRLWDLTLRSCVRQFVGHVAQVQSLRLLLLDKCDDDRIKDNNNTGCANPTTLPPRHSDASPSSRSDLNSLPLPPPHGTGISCVDGDRPSASGPSAFPTTRQNPVLISGSLDNTIKMWDIDSGKALTTFFGHIEGVWAVASDKMRLVSGSHDRTIKVLLSLSFSCNFTHPLRKGLGS